MKKLRSVFALLLAFTMVLALSGCVTDAIKDLLPDNGNKGPAESNPTPSGEVTSAAEREVKVVDAFNYEKDVIVAPEYADMADGLGDMKHKIRFPKITSDTESATAFNRKIYDESIKGYDVLKNNKEGVEILTRDYEAKIYNGYIGIIVSTFQGAQFAGASVSYAAYYYDIKKDAEITYDQYLIGIGVSKDKLIAKVGVSKELADASEFTVVYCIADKNGTVVICSDVPESMDGWVKTKIGPIV